MDPITASTTLATVVGLLCNYKQERGNKKELNHRDFIEWLDYHRHEDIKNSITNTHTLQEEINRLLREDHTEILKKLDSINDGLTQMLSRVSGFKVLVKEFGSDAKLSEQALSILSQFANSKGRELVFYQGKESMLYFLPIGTGSISVLDKRFLYDDLQTLASFQLIQQTRSNDDGSLIYSLTRDGEAYSKKAAK